MDVFDLVAKIRLDSSDYESGISKVGKGLKTFAKVGAAAVSAGVAGVTALTKMGVQGYAQYEQLVGGVETLFKTSGDAVMKYAESAYKTAGVSANAYMETVTSFSASLIQSLDGDTARAAEVGNMAITDMSDNANKMGTSMQMIQNAYQGFAKGNFMMLDNLKLGYGGTKTEMERLLADAQKISGIKYDVKSYADIVEAIHTIQKSMEISGYSVEELSGKLKNASLTQEEVSKVAESMGISYEEAAQKMKDGSLTVKDANVLLGTTAKEAATTIQGSLSMMKGAWENLVVGMANENANMELLINNFVESTATAAQNLLPRIEQTLVGIGQLVTALAPIIATALPQLVESVLPSMLAAATQLVTTIFAELPNILAIGIPFVIDAAMQVAMAFINVMSENASGFTQTGIDAIVQLVGGIADAIPQIISSAITVLTEFIGTLTSPENLSLLLQTAMQLVSELTFGLVDAIPQLVEAAILLIENLVNFITDPANIESILAMALTLVLAVSEGLIAAIPHLTGAAIQLIGQLATYLTNPENISAILRGALDVVLAIADGLLVASVELITAAGSLIDELIAKFDETDWSEVGKTIINALWDGLKEAWKSVSSWFSGVWNALFNRSVNVSSDGNGGVSVSGYATGLNYVPYDGFPAILHRGEAVLTAAEARVWRNGGSGTPAMAGGVVINQYIQTKPQTPAEFASATEAYFEQARWAL